jgi:hypothetical protein
MCGPSDKPITIGGQAHCSSTVNSGQTKITLNEIAPVTRTDVACFHQGHFRLDERIETFIQLTHLHSSAVG